MTKVSMTLASLGVAALIPLTALAEGHASWQPDRPINIIVPWSAGGSTARRRANSGRGTGHRRGYREPAGCVWVYRDESRT